MDKKQYLELKNKLDKLETLLNGGEGSGNFGHAGRPGEVGGSAPEGEVVQDTQEKTKDTPADKNTKLEALRKDFETMAEESGNIAKEYGKKSSDLFDKQDDSEEGQEHLKDKMDCYEDIYKIADGIRRKSSYYAQESAEDFEESYEKYGSESEAEASKKSLTELKEKTIPINKAIIEIYDKKIRLDRFLRDESYRMSEKDADSKAHKLQDDLIDSMDKVKKMVGKDYNYQFEKVTKIVDDFLADVYDDEIG